MDKKYNKKLIPLAKVLRKNMTKEEKHLWYDFLRDYPVKFTRQKVLGRYIADFYCAKANVAVELDGAQHYDDKGIEYDNKRTEYLKTYGIRVVRVTNLDVQKNFKNVCALIDKEVESILGSESFNVIGV